MKELVAAGDKKITDSETAMDAKIADIDTKTAAADAKLKEDMLAAITESAQAQVQARDLMKGELQTEAEEKTKTLVAEAQTAAANLVEQAETKAKNLVDETKEELRAEIQTVKNTLNQYTADTPSSRTELGETNSQSVFGVDMEDNKDESGAFGVHEVARED